MRVIALLRGLMVAPARGPLRVHRGSRGGLPGGQDRGYDPNHRVCHPPRWCGSGATPRNLPDCRSVPPKRLRSAERGENPPISAPPGPFYDFKAETFLVLDHHGAEHGSGSGEARDSEVINPLDGLMQDVSGDGREDNDMEEMLKMMKRKSLAPDDVRKLQVLMMRQKGEGK